jgi:hypothetical protein
MDGTEHASAIFYRLPDGPAASALRKTSSQHLVISSPTHPLAGLAGTSSRIEMCLRSQSSGQPAHSPATDFRFPWSTGNTSSQRML